MGGPSWRPERTLSLLEGMLVTFRMLGLCSEFCVDYCREQGSP